MFSSVPELYPVDARNTPQLCPNIYMCPLVGKITPDWEPLLSADYMDMLSWFFFFMAEAKVVILFKMLPLLMKKQRCQEICTQM